MRQADPHGLRSRRHALGGRCTFKPFRTGLEIVRAYRDRGGRHFLWKQPPYEYETEKLPIDILWGHAGLREGVDRGLTSDAILAEETGALASFAASVEDDLLYD